VADAERRGSSVSIAGHDPYERWKDSRANARALAAAKVTNFRRSALWGAAHRSREEAIAAGHPRYTGRLCRIPGHGGERYVSGGGCVRCARQHAERKRRRQGERVRGERPAARHTLRSTRRAEARQRRSEERSGYRAASLVRPLSELPIIMLKRNVDES
jgi:hypothetical protein